ncbi:hypothetical protein ASG67_14225 [Sphingomonas sp. Leaf339]|nr:hypothetical protein ASG67_14225 [Sphingomonas sp. Leaf339]
MLYRARMKTIVTIAISLTAIGLTAGPVAAQDDQPRRTRVVLGPQLTPSFPGADQVSVRPFIDVSRVRGDDVFAFEAPDESAGSALFRRGRFAIGPAIGFEGRRGRRDVRPGLDTVGFTVEPGAFVQWQATDAIRLRAELRKGLGGHKGWIGSVGADYVVRDRDDWLVSVGPRATLGDRRYHRAYFGVTPAASTASGLPAFDAGGGLQAVGVTAGALRQMGPRWGLMGYAKYDRLVSDAARSPIVRADGSRNQSSGGLALMWTFGPLPGGR